MPSAGRACAACISTIAASDEPDGAERDRRPVRRHAAWRRRSARASGEANSQSPAQQATMTTATTGAGWPLNVGHREGHAAPRRHHDGLRGRRDRQRGERVACSAAAASTARSTGRPGRSCSRSAARSAAARPATRRSPARAAAGPPRDPRRRARCGTAATQGERELLAVAATAVRSSWPPSTATRASRSRRSRPASTASGRRRRRAISDRRGAARRWPTHPEVDRGALLAVRRRRLRAFERALRTPRLSARGGTRTHTPVRARAFKAPASTNSATRARGPV